MSGDHSAGVQLARQHSQGREERRQEPRWEGAASNNMTGPESLDASKERPELPVGCLQKGWQAQSSTTAERRSEYEHGPQELRKSRMTQHAAGRLGLTKEHAVLDPKSWSRAQRWDEIEHPTYLPASIHVRARSAVGRTLEEIRLDCKKRCYTAAQQQPVTVAHPTGA